MTFKSERFYQARRSQSKPLSLRYSSDVRNSSDVGNTSRETLNVITENEPYSESDSRGIGEYDGGRNEVKMLLFIKKMTKFGHKFGLKFGTQIWD